MNTKEQFIKYSKKLATIDYGKDGPTPIDLVEEILDNLPLDWDNRNLRICDPCFGFGTFLYFSYLRLLKYHDESHILNNMLYGIEIEPFRYELTKKKLKIKNLYLGDSLNPTNKIKEILNMKKFDVIIGNPPFQSGKGEVGGRTSLWRTFTKKSFKMVNDDGILSFVCPQFPNDSSDLGNIFTENQTIWVNNGIKKYFKVGSNFVSWCVKKSPNENKTFFIDENVYIKVTKKTLPNILSPITLSILDKIESKQKLEIIYSNGGINHNKLKEETEIQSPNKTKKHTYKLRRTSGDTLYSYSSIIPTHYYKSKITFTKSGYSNFIFHDGNTDPIGTIKHMSGGILCESKDISKNMTWVFSESNLTKIYKDLISSGGMIGFNFIKPILDYKNKVTNSDIYSYYNLTKEEIDYIENYVE